MSLDLELAFSPLPTPSASPQALGGSFNLGDLSVKGVTCVAIPLLITFLKSQECAALSIWRDKTGHSDLLFLAKIRGWTAGNEDQHQNPDPIRAAALRILTLYKPLL
ncbi:hypothetical protein RRG08_043739 [Elysia crispata]|uniref:Uncharacterized protein n=1 Tax=Elysia crispata TaxID=231223 RepID=A0AAE0ZN64_9GAST|nr:hypothetical protein RRG08_043739 [Elysia crispata]